MNDSLGQSAKTTTTTTTTEQRQNVATASRNRRRSKSGGNIKDIIDTADQRQKEEEEGICLMTKRTAAMEIDDGTTQRKKDGITEKVPLASSNIRQFMINFSSLLVLRFPGHWPYSSASRLW
ncbi:hypothetical protein niasHT_017416 [Heterodera trifolii]|uniref:Uncharacterized protein n=1 Tax=Heterodera trifolii TaxID=157864 RepID=A0ABD2LIF4_9BILA